MYLKTLKLVGFKSFADRTRLELRPGVTVVVGPNGSGKSNLVDALSWVFGTQSPKSLRTPKMEDVIFAGTASRPALGRAEVTLVIDNTERMIDLDLDEVSISRRLYRDGSSDYELNGVGCRLLDIQDLLSDSGVGRHQHVIIGQGEIGEVLGASPEDHRAVIEEAAGILKHRRRKERAVRRLERSDEDLLRLDDIVSEITRQLRPLRKQAKAAEHYDQLKDEVVSLSLYLGGQTLAAQDRELDEARAEQSMLAEKQEQEQRALIADEGLLETLRQELAELSEALDDETAGAARLETTNERLRRVAAIAQERRRADAGRFEARLERRQDLEHELDGMEEELSTLGAEEVETAHEAARAEEGLRRIEEAERALATQMALSPEGALAAVNGELSAVEASVARDRREMVAMDHRLEVLGAQAAEEAAQVDEIDAEVRELDSRLGELQAVYEKKRAARSKEQERWSDAEDGLAASRLEHASALARAEAVKSAIRDRVDPVARARVEAAAGALGTLLSRLDVPAGLERAVRAAAGSWLDSVVFESPAAMRDAFASMKRDGTGSVSLLVAGSGPVTARSEAGRLGLDALVDLLGPGADTDLAAGLLGDVIVVEGWSTGWDVVTASGLRAVTPEGDLITSRGARIADPEGSGALILEQCEVAAEQARTGLARAESVHTTAKRDFEKTRVEERAALEAVEAIEATISGRSEAMARLRVSVTAMETEIQRLGERRSALVEALEAGTRQAAELRERIDALEDTEGERARLWDRLERRRLQLAEEKEGARSSWRDWESRHRHASERRRMLDDRRAQLDAELERVPAPEPSQRDPARLEAVERIARKALDVLEEKLVALRERQVAHREEKAMLTTRIADFERRCAGLRSSLATGRQRLSDLELRLTELRLQRESVVERLRRDASAGPEAALGAPRPEIDEEDLEQALADRLARLARQGPINPLAISEHRELSERHEFLTAQMADVEASRSELRKVITALEVEIRQRFSEAFEEVSAAFEHYIAVLFPGGRGRMRLVDPDDPESGVAMEAQPHGKKLAQMSLLSGGERSLAALSFLFAVFEARPSPFYILDEVEAALDDVNLRRFLRVVDEFRGRAQMVIVTHQQQTMEAADVLYGVTMEPGGSSQVLRKEMASIIAPDLA